MRLSEVLNRAPDTTPAQVEGFLGARRLGWGQHKKIEVGRVIRNYFCRACSDMRTFVSADGLSCLVTGERSVSIDVTIRCAVCQAPTEAWFLVGCSDDFFSPAPVVHLERFTENRRDVATGSGIHAGQINDLLECAQIAFDDRLGAGSVIYLRKVFEMVTVQVAGAAHIATTRPNGARKPFKELLEEVDATKHIIPTEFSNNGYTLFRELSQIIHGDSDEAEALRKYEPCRKLVVGVLNNVRNNEDMAPAIASFGWPEPPSLRIVEGPSVA